MKRNDLIFSVLSMLLFIFITACDNKTTESQDNQPPTLTITYPTNNAVDVNLDIILFWSCSDPENDPLTYDVFFGTSSNPPLVNFGQNEATYYPGTLLEEATYYWKIVAKDNNDNETEGDIWQFTTGTGLIPEGMVFVQGGTFEMGDHFNEDWYDELPVHSVTLNDFYIGKYEITQAEYAAMVGSNPASGYGEGDNYPVYNINWYDAITFCNLKSQQDSLTTCYNLSDLSCNFSANGYRLPTEAEWEYAARGGVNWSDDLRYSGCHEESDLIGYAWYISNSDNQTHPVGTKLPNQLNIYDMSGNVYEWCNDWFDYDYYSSSPSNNPTGPENGIMRVVRGGSWNNDANFCRVANRSFTTPSIGTHGGFHVVRCTQ